METSAYPEGSEKVIAEIGVVLVLGVHLKICNSEGINRLTLGARGDVLTRYITSTLQVLGLKN